MSSTMVAESWERDENTPNFLGSLDQAREFLIELGERGAGEYVKEAVDRAAKRSGLPHSRVSDIWYRKARTIDPSEVDAISAALKKRRRDIARNELAELKQRLSRLEAHMARTDPEFFLPSIELIRNQRT